MKTVLTFCVLLGIKVVARLFYYIDMRWIAGKKTFMGTRLIVLLNHTSLFEPIHLSVLPMSLLWGIAKRGVLPGADITMSRPIVGWFFRLVSSSTIPISRRRDKTWNAFLERIRPDSIILIASEGRMKRPNGLDKNGNPMTVRGGVSDLLERVRDGKIAIAYSGGLHHVMSPDQNFPRPFKRIRLAVEILDIAEYKYSLGYGADPRAFRLAVVGDLEKRRDRHCPELELKNTTCTKTHEGLPIVASQLPVSERAVVHPPSSNNVMDLSSLRDENPTRITG